MIKKNFLFNSLIVISIFFFDRLSKLLVIHIDKKILGSEIFSSKFLNITMIWNEGIAFGLLNFEKNNFYNLLTVLIMIIIIVIFFMAFNTKGLR